MAITQTSLRKALRLGPPGLVGLAIVGYLALGPVRPVRAEFALCYYEGKSYSPGAQISDSCSKGNCQTCMESGNWTGCGGCS